MVERIVGNLQDVVSLSTQANRQMDPLVAATAGKSHMAPDQLNMFKSLQDIFQQQTISDDPLAQYGAMAIKQGDLQHFKSPMTVHGVTFTSNYDKSDVYNNPGEAKIMRESGYTPDNVQGKIAIGPEVFSGAHYGTIAHELGHRGVRELQKIPVVQRGPTPDPGSSEEALMRVISIMRNEHVDENTEMLNDMFSKSLSSKEWVAREKPMVDMVQQTARDELKKKGLKAKTK